MNTKKSIYKAIHKTISLLIIFSLFPSIAFADTPSSTNYKIQEYSFGSGGLNNGSSTNFRIHGIAGDVEFGRLSSTNFKAGSGLTYLMAAHLPPAPTITNPDNYYNKLRLTLANGGNPTDSQFAIALSPDNFASISRYVQADMTLGTNPVWQTYTNWGGASGITIIGLTPGSTYTAKVAARQGNFTQTGFGPTAQAATINPTLAFSLTPNAVNIGQLTPQTVVTSGTQVTVTLTTNGTGGGVIYAYGTNNGLLSSSVNYTITSASTDLTGASEGYGIRAVSTSQSSGGPMQKVAPYNGTSNTVGIVDTNKRQMFDSTNQPVTSGTGIFELKAKAANTTKAASDYADIITVIASATF